MTDKADKIARKLSACDPYKYLKTSVKADAFKLDVSDAGGNLKLFIDVLDKLGVKLDGDQLYEEYQKIYDDTLGRNEMYEKEQEQREIIPLRLLCTNDELLYNIPIVIHRKNRYNQEYSIFRELKSSNCKYER